MFVQLYTYIILYIFSIYVYIYSQLGEQLVTENWADNGMRMHMRRDSTPSIVTGKSKQVMHVPIHAHQRATEYQLMFKELGYIRQYNVNRIYSVYYIQETSSETNYISLAHAPSTPVEKQLYHQYRFLLHQIKLMQNVLTDTLNKLILWADGFGIHGISAHNSHIVWQVFDEAGWMDASNLILPRKFFQGIGRFDIVHLIDQFLLGDYEFLSTTMRLLIDTPGFSVTQQPALPDNNMEPQMNGMTCIFFFSS